MIAESLVDEPLQLDALYSRKVEQHGHVGIRLETVDSTLSLSGLHWRELYYREYNPSRGIAKNKAGIGVAPSMCNTKLLSGSLLRCVPCPLLNGGLYDFQPLLSLLAVQLFKTRKLTFHQVFEGRAVGFRVLVLLRVGHLTLLVRRFIDYLRGRTGVGQEQSVSHPFAGELPPPFRAFNRDESTGGR